MLSTKEETKTAVLNHLKLLPASKTQVEAYTLSSISESINVDSSKVSTALYELDKENSVISRKVQLEVYMPKNEQGLRTLSSFASKGYIGYSSYWAMVFAFGLLLVALFAYGNFPDAKYTDGVRNGAILSFLVCFFGGGLLQAALTDFRRWQLVSEKSYRLVSDLFKHSAFLFVPLFVVVYLILSYYSKPLEPTVVIAMLALSVASSFAYEGLKRKRESKTQNEE